MADHPTLTEADLAGFTGTSTWFRHPLFPGVTYTEGVQFLAERAGAYWLIDAVFSHQLDPKGRAEPFRVWTLKRNGDRATLTMTDGNSDAPIIRQEIEYTDFPLDEFSLYFTDRVLLLKSEY